MAATEGGEAMCRLSTPRLRHRLGLVVAVLLFSLTIVAGASALARCFTWNLSSSLPRGLYVLERECAPTRGSVVFFSPPPSAARLIAERGYLPSGASLLKVVVGLPGDFVEVGEGGVSINGRPLGPVISRDRSGRSLEPFVLCGQLSVGEAFVATTAPGSFDSRYFGPVSLSTLVVARPLWTY
jgi:conjugative transfer signal peptidase TraF